MIKLIAGGDSFVWGGDLQDAVANKYSELSWPALLAKQYNFEYICVARGHNSNTAIARSVMNKCQELKLTQKIAVVVQWTFSNRYEFRFNYDTETPDSPWYSISKWTIEDDMSKIAGTFRTENTEILGQEISYVKNAQKLGLADFGKSFMSHVGNSEYYEIYSTLKEIVFLQNYLKINKIPFMFTSATSELFDPNLYSIKNPDLTIKSLLDQIDWDSWYRFPCDQTVDCYPRGFYRWAIENKYKMGTLHPLEEAHQDAAQLIKEKFNELVTQFDQ